MFACAGALAPDSDSVIYQDRVIHVASWAARFLFANEDLNRPVGKLSGGERARVLIAQLMLQSADVLLLDEPTNDLDIPTLEILEESLLEFRGALILVTHDRYMLDRVSTSCWVWTGWASRALRRLFAVGSLVRSRKAKSAAAGATTNARASRERPDTRADQSKVADGKKQRSQAESREAASIEKRIAKAEDVYCRPNALCWSLRKSPVTLCACTKLSHKWNRRRRLLTNWVTMGEIGKQRGRRG